MSSVHTTALEVADDLGTGLALRLWYVMQCLPRQWKSRRGAATRRTRNFSSHIFKNVPME